MRKQIPLMLALLLSLFTLAACTEPAPDEPEPLPTQQNAQQIMVADHLYGIISNARFLDIPTYEHSGQIVHPHVLFFAEPFLGYHYLMVMTPYPYSNRMYENPSILGSQDGILWEVPVGVVNPVSGVPVDVMDGGHYSDPFLLPRGDTLELWFRHTMPRYIDGEYVQDSMHNRIYRTTSQDLIHWSPLETVFDCADGIDTFMSPVVMHDGSVYRLWYANYYSVLYYTESADLIHWTPRERLQSNLGGFGIWHHDIMFTGELYEALLLSADFGNEPRFRLFYTTSYDGIHFEPGRELVPGKISPALEGMTAYKSTFVRQNGMYQIYLSVFTRDSEWKLFYFEIAEYDLCKLFD